jgi:NAD(P)H-hydrate repair Nnr-like enzyme with NAD(P)H-hydrate dehydratase domain
MLGSSAGAVQADRFHAARRLAEQFQCVVVLKGSGTVISAPGQIAMVNPTGNARLATAGTGDVLAGMLGALLASGQTAFEAACNAVFQHGQNADDWSAHHPGHPLTASLLAQNHQADL